MSNLVSLTTPTGRIVSGDVYREITTDTEGKPLLVKSGPNAGQPKVNYYIGVAIPKTAGVPWESEAWGQQIMGVARTVQNVFDPATGQVMPGRHFAFKVTDGDSTIPNQNMKKPCEQEGYPGNWILNFSNGFPPKVCDAQGSKYLPEPGLVKKGYYVQVLATIGANTDSRNPGVFLNHSIVSLQGYGEEIFSGPDMTTAGFGSGPAPVGMSAIPVGAVAVASQPAPAPVAAVAQPAPVAPVTPATDLAPPPPAVAAEVSYIYNGVTYTKSQLLGFPGWTEAHLAALQKA